MGKGNRGREGRDDSILTATQKTKKQKRGHRPLPKWLAPTLVSVVAFVVVFAIVFSALVNNGVFKRNNVLVKNQVQSKFSINQYTAQIMLWASLWDDAKEDWTSEVEGDETYSALSDSNKTSYIVLLTISSLTELTQDPSKISVYADWLERSAALCAYGQEKGIPFTAEDEEAAYSSLISQFRSQAVEYYGSGSSDYVNDPSNSSFKQYLQLIFGSGISSADFRRAANVLYYSSYVSALQQLEYWNADESEIAKELKENPGNYYSLDYLKYTTDDEELAQALKDVVESENAPEEFKKLIVANYVKNNCVDEYSKQLANAILTALKDKTGDDLAAALEENGLTIVEYVKPVEEPAPEGEDEDEEPEGEGDAEPAAGEGEAEATEGEAEATGGEAEATEGEAEATEGEAEATEGEAEATEGEDEATEGEDEATEGEDEEEVPAVGGEEAVLTEKQSAWLFDGKRIANDKDVITEEDGSYTFLAITEINDTDGITVVKAAIQNYAVDLSEEEINALINKVFHELGLSHDHDAEAEGEGDAEATEGEGDAEATEGEGNTETTEGEGDAEATEGEGDAEATEGEGETEATEGEGDAEATEGEGNTETTEQEAESTPWDKMVETMVTNVKNELPSVSKMYYAKGVEKIKAELEEKETADDKVKYLKDISAAEYLGTTSDNNNLSDEIKAVVFPEEGTVAEGLTQIVEVGEKKIQHLIYVKEVKTEGEGEEAKTAVTFYDYTASESEAAFRAFLFNTVDEETMEGSPAVYATFYDESTGAVYIVTRALGLGEDVVRGAYLAFSNVDEANAAKEKLNGLTGVDLLSKISEISSSATISNKIKESNLSISKPLQNWLFSEDRVANDCAVVYEKDEKNNITEGIYLAVYLYKTSEGESDARSSIASTKTTDLASTYAEEHGYKINEKALAKIGTWLYK